MPLAKNLTWHSGCKKRYRCWVNKGVKKKPSIYADAAYAVLKRDSSTCTGNFFLDQDVLEEEGVSDFDQYAIDPDATLVSDFFVDDNPEGWIQA